MNLLKEKAVNNLMKALVVRNLAVGVWGDLPRLGKVVGTLGVALLVGLVLGAVVLILERPKTYGKTEDALAVPRKTAPWNDSFGLPYKPRGLF